MKPDFPLPPIAALRAFEAAARLASFTRAGEELAMTQAAVSYQIKQLETRLGVTLFRRAGRHVELTAAGQRLSDAASEAFGLLRAACANIAEQKHVRVWITALPTVASNWLVPRLGDFRSRHPDYAVQLDSSVAVADMRVSAFDVAIRRGKGTWPGCEAQLLFHGNCAVVCAPGLIAAAGIERPEDLTRIPLFGRRSWWHRWFAAAAVPEAAYADLEPTDLGTEESEVTAALMQDGAAIVTASFFERDLASERIRQPFAITLTQETPYWLVYRAGTANLPNIRDFRKWLMAQIPQ